MPQKRSQRTPYPRLYDPHSIPHFACYKTRESHEEESFFKAVLTWILQSILYLILIIPFLIIICIISLILPLFTWHIFRSGIAWIWVMAIVSISYILHYLDIYPSDIHSFYSMFPLVIIVVFRRAVGSCFGQNTFYLLREMKYRSTWSGCCQKYTYGIIARPAIIEKLYDSAMDCHPGYSLWYYRPFGRIKSNSSKSEKSSYSMKEYMKKSISRFTSIKYGTFDYKDLKVYTKSEKLMMILLEIFAWSYVIIPFIVYIVNAYKKWDDEGFVKWVIIMTIQTVSGLIANAVIVHFVARYTEYFLFYHLFEYYAYMRRMGDLLEIDDYKGNRKQIMFRVIIKKSKQKEDAAITQENKEQKVMEEDSYQKKQGMIPLNERPNDNNDDDAAAADDDDDDDDEIVIPEQMSINMEGNKEDERKAPLLNARPRRDAICPERMIPLTRKKDAYYKPIDDDIKLKIYLHEAKNCEIWFENWCRIENIAYIYFENRKWYIFAVITCIVAAVGIIVYKWFNGNELLNANLVTVYIGLCYFFLVYIRLLLTSMRFSDLQRRHIRLIQNQRIFALHQMKEKENFPEEKQLNNQYMKGMIEQIESRSLSPTIAGLSLDKALVKLTITTLIGFATSAITYVLKNRS